MPSAYALFVSVPGGYLPEVEFSRIVKLVLFHAWRQKTRHTKSYKAKQSGMHTFSSAGEINAEFGNNILNLKLGDFWLFSVQVAAKARKEMGHVMWSGQ